MLGYILCAMGGGMFGFTICALLVAGRDADVKIM